ncbi:MAG: 3-deoxy-manno-octulosonate cytidylyltransferase (CMP-KDO synthetase) [Bacteroidetes bacterium]|nr:MAG: 3-deoxy-manno-octulosonate cytidylyltransferase (CMP-KDO synthetase) [Bacteroidota bacterium]
MNILGIIPARYASTRFPGKPLVDIAGKTMIRRVYEQASKSALLKQVYAATDDARIEAEVKSFGGNVIMTSADHRSGTDRCAESVQKIAGDWDVVINIQGDEPFIHPEQIDLLCSLFQSAETQIGTLVKKAHRDDEVFNPNTIKVTVDKNGYGLYFSRSPIPFLRNFPQEQWLANHTFLKHIGIYGYRKEILLKLTQLPEGNLEKAESLEQLRWLENGYRIRTAFTELESVSVDSPEDLGRLPG